MIEELLHDAIVNADFSHILDDESYSFYEKEKEGHRFLILARLESLPSIDDLHKKIFEKIPERFSSHLAFRKNCDLVVIHSLADLSGYDELESIILSYEEDPYHFKKYFLCISKQEKELIEKKESIDLPSILEDQEEFSKYKESPNSPSLYGLVSRIFIKMPFLALPRAEREFVPISVQLDEAVQKANLTGLWRSLSEAPMDDGLEAFVERMVNEELENIKNSNSGV
ncbi:hypothetical protein [Burkholderia sp. Ax-1719]|uniref:hypothetical protein n=1 Tax=Burkholderia sp. Ax-1719 TaxID=2608334 RepID=UPI0014237ABF|nr:hypothetical protein [Burkholderia sp. Ax-1719]NIE63135.1 hypothetical protein [Burkholderia sp. Ax-1719]